MTTTTPRVFFASTALVMLHVADDQFIQPADGVAATDHLVSGLVWLGLLTLALVAYPRVRAGAQALLALAVGITGLVVGAAESVYYTVKLGPSGDDFTGFAAAIAGVVLLGVAVVTAWRSRKPGRSKPRTYVRRGLIGTGVLVVLMELVFPFALAYVATHIQRAGVPEADLGAAHEDVTLTTSDGLELEGWYVPSRNGAAVIVYAGRVKTQPLARVLVEHGYGVLLFDRRGEGESDGDGNMFGWGGARDIHAAVDFLKEQPDVEPGRIGGFGLSVAGEMMLQSAAENPDLAAVVTEGAGTRTLSEDVESFETPTLIRSMPALVAKHAGMLLNSNESPPPSLLEITPRIGPRPVLLIWAPSEGSRESINPTYERLIGPSAEAWAIPDATHVTGLQTRPEEYERRVVGFFDDALL